MNVMISFQWAMLRCKERKASNDNKINNSVHIAVFDAAIQFDIIQHLTFCKRYILLLALRKKYDILLGEFCIYFNDW